VSPARLKRVRRHRQVAERERKLAKPGGKVFAVRSMVMEPGDVARALLRMAHEILERNHGVSDLIVVGLQTGGVPLADRLRAHLEEITGMLIPLGTLDVAFYRDDYGIRPVLPEEVTLIPCDLTQKTVVLVDDVLFTGRTVRAALDALSDHGRAKCIQLAVMVDRGHRELPIKPDYVGKNLPTRRDEMVDVSDKGVALGELVDK